MMYFALRPLAKNKTPTLHKIMYFQRIYHESIKRKYSSYMTITRNVLTIGQTQIIFSEFKIKRKGDEKVCLSYQPKQIANLFLKKKYVLSYLFYLEILTKLK